MKTEAQGWRRNGIQPIPHMRQGGIESKRSSWCNPESQKLCTQVNTLCEPRGFPCWTPQQLSKEWSPNSRCESVLKQHSTQLDRPGNFDMCSLMTLFKAWKKSNKRIHHTSRGRSPLSRMLLLSGQMSGSYSLGAINMRHVWGLAHAQISDEQRKTWCPWNREGNYSKYFSLSLPHFITSPTVFSHNLTLLLSLSQPHFTTSFLPNTGGAFYPWTVHFGGHYGEVWSLSLFQAAFIRSYVTRACANKNEWKRWLCNRMSYVTRARANKNEWKWWLCNRMSSFVTSMCCGHTVHYNASMWKMAAKMHRSRVKGSLALWRFGDASQGKYTPKLRWL